MPAHIVHGDPFLASRRIREIKSEAGLNDPAQYAEQKFEAGAADVQDVVNACRARPFLEDARVTVVEGVLGTRERGQQRAAKGLDQLAQTIPVMPRENLLILTDVKVSKSNPLLKHLQAHCTIHETPAPAGNGLTRWVVEAARGKGNAIRADAAKLLADTVGNDMWQIEQELEKLSLYCDEREIGVDDINQVVEQAREANIFAAVDAIVDNRSGEALRMVSQL
jgi:DNA polymerase III delta subunit